MLEKLKVTKKQSCKALLNITKSRTPYNIGVVTGASSLCLHKKILNNDETTLLRDNKYRLPNDGQLISTKTSYRDKV